MEVYPPGIPDDAFLRGSVPITESEVRAVTMSRARLRPTHRVLDIGAGTGSLTIEAALLCPDGEVIAVENAPEALQLLRANIAHFGVRNVTVIAGEAPDVLANMDPFDRLFLGGFGTRLHDLLAAIPHSLKSGGWLVTNTIDLASTAAIAECLRLPPWTAWEMVHLTASRGVLTGDGELLCFQPVTPVWVASAQRR